MQVRSPRSRLRAAAISLAVGALVAAGLVVSVPAAQAYTLYYYCNILTPAYTRCADQPAYQSYNFNHAEYDGGGIVNVCQHTYTPDYATASRRCGNNVAGSASDLDFYWAYGFYLHPICGNNSTNQHTIFCWAQRG